MHLIGLGIQRRKKSRVGESGEVLQGKLHLISLKVVSILTKAGMENDQENVASLGHSLATVMEAGNHEIY